MASPIIEIKNLSFTFNGHDVLKNVDLTVNKGEFLALIGPNGGGKTTLLRILLGLLQPHRGTIKVFGRPPRDISHRIGYVPQDVQLNRNFPVSAIDVVLMGRLRSGKGRSRYSREDRMMAQNALSKVELNHCANRRIDELSGGQRQRIFIARALVSEPELLLLDEPTSSIDTPSQSEFYALLKDLNQSATILLVSHDLMILSSYVKSVACVNQLVHHHDEAEVTEDMLAMYECPVELVAHGLPHRVLRKH